jgi:hypothetical protein
MKEEAVAQWGLSRQKEENKQWIIVRDLEESGCDLSYVLSQVLQKSFRQRHENLLRTKSFFGAVLSQTPKEQCKLQHDTSLLNGVFSFVCFFITHNIHHLNFRLITTSKVTSGNILHRKANWYR